RRHTRFSRDWSSDVCSSDLGVEIELRRPRARGVLTPEVGAAALEILEGRGPLAEILESQFIEVELADADGKIFGPVVGDALEHEIGRASCREGVESSVLGSR